MKRKQYASLDDIRQEKEKARVQMGRDVDMLKNHVNDCFVAPENFFLQSSNKYMNYVGYAITAYKMVGKVKGLFGRFSKKK